MSKVIASKFQNDNTVYEYKGTMAQIKGNIDYYRISLVVYLCWPLSLTGTIAV